jgi:uncharacterized protein (DUF1015 family)
MAEIVPFRGVHYDAAKVSGLEKVVGPPYDVISTEEQDALYADSPVNYVRVMLNRAEPGDDERNNPYVRAGAVLQQWLDSGVLVEDDAPALYVYRQEFTHPADGRRLTRTVLLCALKLEPYSAGVVLPHEETKAKAKEDRLRLMRATRANPEPILGMFEDPTRFVAKAMESAASAAPPFQSVTVDGDHHRVWRVGDADTIRALQRFMRDRRVWIADGHHRYETALTYRDERRAAEERGDAGTRGRGETASGRVGEWASGRTTPNDPTTQRPNHPTPYTLRPTPYDYILIALVPFNDPGVVVLPTHRLVRNVPETRLEQLSLQLERYFDMESVALAELPDRMVADPSGEAHRFGMVSREGAWTLTLRDVSVMDAAVEGHSAVWKRLDVSILHALALERSLGIPGAAPNIGYTRDRAEAVVRVQSGEYQLVFLLNLPSAEEVRRVAAAGDKMPPKSTFFYPKLWSGLLLRKL